MIFGLPLAFTAPAVLAALAGLPVLYFLLRITPPRPVRIPFPPLRLILGLQPKEETPSRTPWWVLLLRLAVAASLILAMSGPVLNPFPAAPAGAGPLLIAVDDGWPSAPSWEERLSAAKRRLEAAERSSRLAAILPISQEAREIIPASPSKVIEELRALKPVPFIPDKLAVFGAAEKFAAAHPGSAILWIADGIENGGAREFAKKLAALPADVSIFTSPTPIRAIAEAQNQSGGLEARVLRSSRFGPEKGLLRALDQRGLSLGEAAFDFGAGNEARAGFDLPAELRNEIARLEIADEHSAGAVFLLDERWRRRRVGIMTGETADVAQPLLAPDYYLKKALAPSADVSAPSPSAADPAGSLLGEHVSVMILADVGTLAEDGRERLERFVADGGILVRFAGPHLAGGSDELVPVRLRRGGRVLGGAMSWETPKKLAPFERTSPFFGLAVPDDVTISRQVLAEPDPGLSAKTWASLADGTPLVTASRQGKGLIILFHVTADTGWSNLPISGLFVDMLRKIIDLSPGSMAAGQQASPPPKPDEISTLAPRQVLDGFGVLGPPSGSAKPIPANFEGSAGPDHPPGFYGPPGALRALNTLGSGQTLEPADYSGLGVSQQPLSGRAPMDLRPFLLIAAFLLFAADTLASFWLSGALARPARAAGVVILAFLAAAAAPGRVSADPAISQRDIAAALTTRLAYVATGDPRVDDVTRQGLVSLSRALAERTSLNPGEPVAVDPARDELAFYPLLYWPVSAARPQPPREAAAKAALFMKQGGTIVFDTRDAPLARPGGAVTPESKWLRQLLDGIDLPPLEPVPADHVVTKTFYLLDGFFGRYTEGTTWIEALPPAPADGSPRPARAGDSVSPIIITSNDLAVGWASDQDGEALYPLSPGGERQHELALRGGINLVMYTLTGNYKSDQVHVRDLLERLAH